MTSQEKKRQASITNRLTNRLMNIGDSIRRISMEAEVKAKLQMAFPETWSKVAQLEVELPAVIQALRTQLL